MSEELVTEPRIVFAVQFDCIGSKAIRHNPTPVAMWCLWAEYWIPRLHDIEKSLEPHNGRAPAIRQADGSWKPIGTLENYLKVCEQQGRDVTYKEGRPYITIYTKTPAQWRFNSVAGYRADIEQITHAVVREDGRPLVGNDQARYYEAVQGLGIATFPAEIDAGIGALQNFNDTHLQMSLRCGAPGCSRRVRIREERVVSMLSRVVTEGINKDQWEPWPPCTGLRTRLPFDALELAGETHKKHATP